MHPVTFPSQAGKTSQAPRIVAIIPARYQSSRLPAKPLADLAGQPMIEHVYRRAAEARGIDAVIVATDDERIARVVEQFGGTVRMTAATHRTGTDRVAEVAATLACDVVVNVQGDLPLLQPGMLSELIAPFAADPAVTMSTLRRQAAAEEYANPNVVKVVVDRQGDALYFSRSPVPYFRDGPPKGGRYDESRDGPPKGGHYDESRDGPPEGGQYDETNVVSGFSRTWKHIGLYGYRRDFLLLLAGLPPTPLEQAESLEQLRALEHGFRIRTVETRYSTIEVDTPEDLERVRRHLMAAARA